MPCMYIICIYYIYTAKTMVAMCIACLHLLVWTASPKKTISNYLLTDLGPSYSCVENNWYTMVCRYTATTIYISNTSLRFSLLLSQLAWMMSSQVLFGCGGGFGIRRSQKKHQPGHKWSRQEINLRLHLTPERSPVSTCFNQSTCHIRTHMFLGLLLLLAPQRRTQNLQGSFKDLAHHA